jgi:hypothetical protein
MLWHRSLPFSIELLLVREVQEGAVYNQVLWGENIKVVLSVEVFTPVVMSVWAFWEVMGVSVGKWLLTFQRIVVPSSSRVLCAESLVGCLLLKLKFTLPSCVLGAEYPTKQHHIPECLNSYWNKLFSVFVFKLYFCLNISIYRCILSLVFTPCL